MRQHLITGLMVVIILVLSAPCSYSYLWKDEKRGSDLSVFALGTFRVNYATIHGDVLGFESSDDGFAQDFDSEGFLSFMVDGSIFHDYALEGELTYNEEHNPDWNYYFELSRDTHRLLFGDQPDIFSELYFSHYAHPLRGLTLYINPKRLGVTTFGALTRGEAKTQEIVPNGTSGPYHLASLPVVVGSERITLEIRNQHDQTQVIESIVLEQDVDYSIEYDTGRIALMQPLDPETPGGDPVVIVLFYRSEEEFSSFRTAVAGARVTTPFFGGSNIGMAYISEFARDPGLSEGFGNRQEVYSIESAIPFGESIMLTTEQAFSRNHQDWGDDNPVRQAFQAVLTGSFGQKASFSGEYRLAERDFLTFANPAVKTAEQELKLTGNYALARNQSLEIGYNFLQDNLPRDPEMPTTTTNRASVGWNFDIREQTKLFSTYEFIQSIDDQTPRTTDKQTHVILVGGIQEFATVPVLRNLLLHAEYQYSDAEDQTDQEADTLTHQARLRLRAEPYEDVAASVEQRECLVYDTGPGKNTERQDISELGVELERWERFSAQAKYQYRVVHDVVRHIRNSEKHTMTLSCGYQVSSVLKFSGKVERRDESFFDSDQSDDQQSQDSTEMVQLLERSSQGLNLEGQVLLTLQRDFSARLRYTYEYAEDQDQGSSTTREDATELLVNYAFDQRKIRLTGALKIERDLLETQPTPRTETQTVTYSVSGTRQLTDRWEILAQYKRKMTALAADNFREDILGEIGYKAGRFVEFGGGYQHSRFRDNDDSANDYAANSIYIKIVGKL